MTRSFAAPIAHACPSSGKFGLVPSEPHSDWLSVGGWCDDLNRSSTMIPLWQFDIWQRTVRVCLKLFFLLSSSQGHAVVTKELQVSWTLLSACIENAKCLRRFSHSDTQKVLFVNKGTCITQGVSYHSVLVKY